MVINLVLKKHELQINADERRLNALSLDNKVVAYDLIDAIDMVFLELGMGDRGC